MKPLEIDWKDQNLTLKFGLDKFDKKKLSMVSDDVIDLLRKTHKLSPVECGFVLDNLLTTLEEILAEEWKTHSSFGKKETVTQP